jgi:hypothetical protein
MGARWGVLTLPMLAGAASTSNVGTIIETFVIRQFSNTVSHYWVINETPWDGDEIIVDMHTIMHERRATEPTVRHSCC